MVLSSLSFIVLVCICANIVYTDIDFDIKRSSPESTRKYTPHARVSFLWINLSFKIISLINNFKFYSNKSLIFRLYILSIIFTFLEFLYRNTENQGISHHFPKETECLPWFCKLNVIIELQGANNNSNAQEHGNFQVMQCF